MEGPGGKGPGRESPGGEGPEPGGTQGTADVATETCHVGVMTDPESLGPCEPGTSVVLEGIVWSESNNGQSGGF